MADLPLEILTPGGASSLFSPNEVSGGESPTKARNNPAAASVESKEFAKRFLDIMKPYKPLETEWKESSEHLRLMLKTGPLSIFDLQQNPHLFFLAHRLLADSLCAGFGIRYTVQFNLFAGSIIGLGTDEQAKEWLTPIQKNGQLGCFALTETSAGVLSGLIVETTATWDNEKKVFILQTPNESASKNWISQGLAAEFAVVVASLVTKHPKKEGEKKNFGPHAFVIRMRDDQGNLLPGIKADDMGRKTVANDLDNARLFFEKVEIPLSGLLQRYCTIDEKTGEYKQTTSERMRIEVIGQRLLTGRLAIAEMATEGVKKIFLSVKQYTDNKKIHPAPGQEYPLSDVPQLKAVYSEGLYKLTRMQDYAFSVEKSLCECLRANKVPGRRLVEEIAVAKIKALEVSIDVSHKLEQEVGSFSIMMGSGFEHKDVLLCCKFAEGDSRILQQKLVRDCLKWVSEMGMGTRIFNHVLFGGAQSRARMLGAMKLAKRLQGEAATKGPIKAWNDAYEQVYEYADLLSERYIENRVGPDKTASKL